MLMSERALLATALLAGAVFAPVARASEIFIGSEVTVTPPVVEQLPNKRPLLAAPPVWTGDEWRFAWSEMRYGVGHTRTFLHQLSATGVVPARENVTSAPGEAVSMFRFGNGFILGTTSGTFLLDETGSTFEPILPTSNLTRGGGAFLAWAPRLSAANVVDGSRLIPVDMVTLRGDTKVWRDGTVASDGDSFLVVWVSRHPGQPASIYYNEIRRDGSVVHETPRLLGPPMPRIETLHAGWNGDRYVIGGTRQIPPPSFRWDYSAVTLDATTGEISEPFVIRESAGWNWEHPQTFLVEPGVLMFAWAENDPSTQRKHSRAVFLDGASTLGPASVIADESVILGFDEVDRFASISLSSTSVNLLRRSGHRLEPETGRKSIRFGFSDKTELVKHEGDPYALILSGDASPYFLMTLTREPSRVRFERDTIVASAYSEADYGVMNGTRLVAWSQRTLDGKFEVFYSIDAPHGDASDPVLLGEGLDPAVFPHEGGWLLTFRDRRMMKETFVGADGAIANPPEDFIEHTPHGEWEDPFQSRPVSVTVSHDEMLIFWQEGELSMGPCNFTCPRPMMGALVRSMLVRDGEPDRSTARSYGWLARPAVVRVGNQILLVGVRQSAQKGRSRIEGQILDFEGEPVGDRFVIADDVEAWQVRSPDLAVLGSKVLAVWARETDGRKYTGELEGAIIDMEPRPSPEVTRFSSFQENLGAIEHELVAEGGNWATLYYVRRDGSLTWQVYSRTIQIDPMGRRRAAMRR